MSERIERTSHESTMIPSGFEEMGSIYDMHSGAPTGLYYLQAGQHPKSLQERSSFTSKADSSQCVSWIEQGLRWV